MKNEIEDIIRQGLSKESPFLLPIDIEKISVGERLGKNMLFIRYTYKAMGKLVGFNKDFLFNKN